MTESLGIVTGRDLLEKWDMEPVHLVYLLAYQDIDVINPWDDRIPWDEVVPQYFEDKSYEDIAKETFLVSDIEKLHEKFGKSIPNSDDIVSWKEVTERWNQADNYIFQLIVVYDLNVVDRFGENVDQGRFWSLCGTDGRRLSEQLFLLKDIEEFEAKYPEVIAEPVKAEMEDDEESPHQTFYFYKSGDGYWNISQKGKKEKPFKHRKGFEFIQFLIKYEGDEIDPLTLYHLGKVPEEYTSLYLDKQKKGDKKSEMQIEDRIEFLEERLSVETDVDKRIVLQDEISKSKKFLRESENTFKHADSEKYRLNVYKCIKPAIEAIHNEAPILKDYLILATRKTEGTIKAGWKCKYKSDPSFPVKWILNPEE